jgi:hypothetical protein
MHCHVTAIVAIRPVGSSTESRGDAMIQILEGAAVIAALSLYLLPSIEADARGHSDAFAITAVNILLGWTIVGWFAARAWSRSQHEGRVLARAVRKIRSTAGHLTSQKIVQHVRLRAALESHKQGPQRNVTRPCV